MTLEGGDIYFKKGRYLDRKSLRGDNIEDGRRWEVKVLKGRVLRFERWTYRKGKPLRGDDIKERCWIE